MESKCVKQTQQTQPSSSCNRDVTMQQAHGGGIRNKLAASTDPIPFEARPGHGPVRQLLLCCEATVRGCDEWLEVEAAVNQAPKLAILWLAMNDCENDRRITRTKVEPGIPWKKVDIFEILVCMDIAREWPHVDWKLSSESFHKAFIVRQIAQKGNVWAEGERGSTRLNGMTQT